MSSLFKLLDSNGDGFLDLEEMHHFARCTGFSGHADEWKEEYNRLFDGLSCTASEGVDARSFANLVNDESAAGCYCTDEDLVTMISQLNQTSRFPPVSRAPPVSRPSASRIPPATRLPPGLAPPSPGETTKDVADSSLPVAHDSATLDGGNELLALIQPSSASHIREVVAEGDSWETDQKQHSDGEEWADWDQWKEAAAQPEANQGKGKRNRQHRRGGWQSAEGGADEWAADVETTGADASWSGAQAAGSDAQWSANDDSWWESGNAAWSTRPAGKVKKDDNWWAADKDWSDSGGWQASKAQSKGNARGKGRGKGKKDKSAGW